MQFISALCFYLKSLHQTIVFKRYSAFKWRCCHWHRKDLLCLKSYKHLNKKKKANKWKYIWTWNVKTHLRERKCECIPVPEIMSLLTSRPMTTRTTWDCLGRSHFILFQNLGTHQNLIFKLWAPLLGTRGLFRGSHNAEIQLGLPKIFQYSRNILLFPKASWWVWLLLPKHLLQHLPVGLGSGICSAWESPDSFLAYSTVWGNFAQYRLYSWVSTWSSMNIHANINQDM